MSRQAHLIALVAFLIGCAVLLLVVGCSGTSSETSNKKEQARSPQATASEEARCEGTRTIKKHGESVVTNDVPGCPKGGLLLGTDKADKLYGGDGDDKIRGLGGRNELYSGLGDDVLYGGDGDEYLVGGLGEDVIYGDDYIWAMDGFRHHRPVEQRDEIYCAEGRDVYVVADVTDKSDHVSSSCEKKRFAGGGA